jgi:hypothetical protein
MLSALIFTVRSLRAALLSEGHLSGPLRPQPTVISLGRDELPDYLLRDLGIFDGNRSDRVSCHPEATRPAGILSTRGASGGRTITMAAGRRRMSHDHS